MGFILLVEFDFHTASSLKKQGPLCNDCVLSVALYKVGGAAVMAVGIWTLIDKSDYLSLLASSTFAVSAYILIFAGGLVMITGFLGCCAVIREQRSCLSARCALFTSGMRASTLQDYYGTLQLQDGACEAVLSLDHLNEPESLGGWDFGSNSSRCILAIEIISFNFFSRNSSTVLPFSSHSPQILLSSQYFSCLLLIFLIELVAGVLAYVYYQRYFSCLLLIFLIELVAGVLAYVYYQRLSEELKQHLNHTMTENYAQPGKNHITHAVDRLQQDFKCCGSNHSSDWQYSVYIRSQEAGDRVVPDSCCKTITLQCGQRDHPSNIYKVEGGCITKLEQFLANHLLIIGAVGIGVACLQGGCITKLEQFLANHLLIIGAVGIGVACLQATRDL
ncbi:UNVERIFIED_CONTAM: hypothetical protein FKN15_030719 [Acipenser sinensis]